MAIWTFLTWLVTAVTTWHCLLWLLFIVLNIILLRWLVVMLTARITLVFTCFMTLLLTRYLNHFFMHLMLLRSGSFRLNLLTRFFVLRITWFFVVMTRCSFITFSRFFSITFLFLRYSRWCQVSIAACRSSRLRYLLWSRLCHRCRQLTELTTAHRTAIDHLFNCCSCIVGSTRLINSRSLFLNKEVF